MRTSCALVFILIFAFLHYSPTVSKSAKNSQKRRNYVIKTNRKQYLVRTGNKRGISCYSTTGLLLWSGVCSKIIFAEKPSRKHRTRHNRQLSPPDQAGTCPAGARQGVPNKSVRLFVSQGVNIDCGKSGDCIQYVHLESCLTGFQGGRITKRWDKTLIV